MVFYFLHRVEAGKEAPGIDTTYYFNRCAIRKYGVKWLFLLTESPVEKSTRLFFVHLTGQFTRQALRNRPGPSLHTNSRG